MTLTQAQQAFRQTPNRLNALAYMDAAIVEWETCYTREPHEDNKRLKNHLLAIRNWLKIESDPFNRGFTFDTKDNQ